MLKGIDHIVVVVPELEAAIKSYGELGFTVGRGGKHNIGTHNALIAFADGSYMELIAFLAPVAGHPWYDAISKSGGLVDFCAQTDDLDADVASFRRAGVNINDPNAMSRDRPDGYRVKWVLAIPNPPFNGSVPFLIKDETPREERMPREHNHRNGVTGIASLMIAVADAAKVAQWYRVNHRRQWNCHRASRSRCGWNALSAWQPSARCRFAARAERTGRGIPSHPKCRPLSSHAEG